MLLLQRIPPCTTLHRNLVRRHSSTKRKHMYVSYTNSQANDHSLIYSRRPCQVSLQLSSCDICSRPQQHSESQDPDNTASFSILGPALLQMIYSYYGVESEPLSITTTFLNSAGAGASIAVTPGSVDGPRSTSKKEILTALLCASKSVTFPVAVTFCGSRKNVHAYYASVLNPWICLRIELSIMSSSLIFILS